MALKPHDIANFETLKAAFANGDVVLMECTDSETGEYRAVICAAEYHKDGAIEFTPFAILPHENPYDMLNPASV